MFIANVVYCNNNYAYFMSNSQVSNISIYVYILNWGIGNSNNIVFIQFTAILCILIRVAKGGKFPVNFGNVEILETLQDFLESSFP